MKHFVWLKLQIQSLLKDKRAATAIEYGLIAALIGVGLIAGLTAFGDSTNGAWGGMAQKVNETLK